MASNLILALELTSLFGLCETQFRQPVLDIIDGTKDDLNGSFGRYWQLFEWLVRSNFCRREIAFEITKSTRWNGRQSTHDQLIHQIVKSSP